MGYRDMMDALLLHNPAKTPRTEYSASFHWPLVRKVTGLDVNDASPREVKQAAAQAFEKAWDFGFTWSTCVSANHLTGPRTSMGHAAYTESGSDFNDRIFCPFTDVSQVLSFDPFAAYGEKSMEDMAAEFDAHYDNNCKNHPDQVNMTGIYITMISGLIEIFGWDMLLTALGEDPDGFGQVANRYAEWIGRRFTALGKSKAPVVMIHDDIVWTSGPFARPAWYRKYIFPNYLKLFEPLHRAGKRIIYTSDGTYDAFIDDIADCGVNCFVMEPTTDMETVAKKYGRTHAFVGNADCRILTYGDRKAIRAEVERCFRIGRDCPGFIMAVGNHIPPNVPVDNALYYNECYEELAAKR